VLAGVLAVLWPWRSEPEVPAATPPRAGPALLPEPIANLAAYRSEKERELESYGWVDRKAGIARISIERAIEILTRQVPASGERGRPMIRITVFILATGAWLTLGTAAATPEHLFQRVGFEQRLGATLPLDTGLRDQDGHQVRLGDYFKGRPVVLVLGYYRCPNLCSVVWRELLESLQRLKLDVGRDFEVVAVSIDPKESPELAREKQATYAQDYKRPGTESGWHFLTGDEPAVRRIADAVGFHYVYDPEIDQYAHPAGLVVATPQGVVSRYLYGVRFPETDLRLALVESSNGTVGSPVDQLLLLCFHYDPKNGKYGVLIMNLLRVAGGFTAAGLVGFVLVSRRRERRGTGGEAR
jgi:protein SCO1/2